MEDVWGVGHKLTNRLASSRVTTALDLREAHIPTLRAEFGVVMEKTQRELQEAPCIKLEEVRGDKKKIVSTRSFGSMVTELLVLKDALSTFVANACGKLRAEKNPRFSDSGVFKDQSVSPRIAPIAPCLAVPCRTLPMTRWR